MPQTQNHEINNGAEVERKDSLQSTASALFDAAYENPGKTALIVGGTAAAIGLAVAGRGQIARLLPHRREGILLVEDTPYMGKAFCHALEEQGEKVTWFTGVKKLHPFTGITNEGKEVTVDPSRFKFAFVDGELIGSKPQGEHVVDALKSGHLDSFGISTIRSINDSMRAHGATVSAEKPAALTALVNHTLDLSKITRAPGQVQIEMDSLIKRMLQPEMKEARKKADAVVMRYLTE